MMKNKTAPCATSPPEPCAPVVIYDLNASRDSSSGSSGDSGSKFDMFLPIQFRCEMCGKRAFNLKSCSRCWWAKYCDNICQRRHWPQHGVVCVEDPKGKQFLKGGHILELDMIASPDHSGSSEQTLSLEMVKCPKHGHNNHSAFIGISNFRKSHLPPNLRLDEVVSYILAESQLTVRVLVSWTSKKRPDEDVCARFRGTTHLRAATGKVMLTSLKDIQVKRCTVPDCHRNKDLGVGHAVFVVDLKVATGRQVVFDDEELAHTTVDFFYDAENGGPGAVREYGRELFSSKSTSDVKHFTVTAHDRPLLQRLERADVHRSACFKSIPPFALRAMSAHAIVVSHPHSSYKRISVGNVVKITEENMTPETIDNAKLVGELEKLWFEKGCRVAHSQMVTAMSQLSLPVYKVWYDAATWGAPAPRSFSEPGRLPESGGPMRTQHSAYDIDAKLNYFKVPRFLT
ncbi:hypothetical protein Btru_007255 [Bulinus truncatus]|nr:hypothetical protein Btru_007255 [Bulinus truncatus]